MIIKQVNKLKVGRPEDDADIVPVIGEASANLVEALITDARDKGATLCQPFRREANLIWPVVVDHVTPAMRVLNEEQFGPVVPIVRVKDAEEALEIANTSKYVHACSAVQSQCL